MSNNKQSMKLYTKEEIKRALDNPVSLNMETDEFIDSLTPIELPSDEDIIKDCKYKSLAGIGWIEGAKWMRDKIQGGIK